MVENGVLSASCAASLNPFMLSRVVLIRLLSDEIVLSVLMGFSFAWDSQTGAADKGPRFLMKTLRRGVRRSLRNCAADQIVALMIQLMVRFLSEQRHKLDKHLIMELFLYPCVTI